MSGLCKVTRQNSHLKIEFEPSVSHDDRLDTRAEISRGLRLKNIKIHGRGRSTYLTADVDANGISGRDRGRLYRGVRDQVAMTANNYLDSLENARQRQRATTR
jgi:hypothetical protein